jgi:alpha-L-rhamnosidase
MSLNDAPLSGSFAPPPLSAGHLRCEYQQNPLGIDVLAPRLSWRMVTNERGVLQTAYQVQAATSAEALSAGAPLLWDSGRIDSDVSSQVAYGGPALASGATCYWQVRVWDNLGRTSAWSASGASPAAWWEMGLLHAGDWQAQWIEPDWDEDPQQMHPCPYLRTTAQLHGPIHSARAYVTAHGLYELHINGATIGDLVFTPGYTAYDKRLQYQTYDVTAQLVAGENVIGVILGDGWYRGKVGAMSSRNSYGTRLALLLQIVVTYADGSTETIISDENWAGTTGPLRRSDMKDGEIYDARLEMPGWDAPGFDAGAWRKVMAVDHCKDNLVAASGPAVRRHEMFSPQIIHTPAGETVADMGQNFAGWTRLRVQGPAGTTITLRHGEMLDKNGNFTMEHLNLGGVKLLQQDQYTLRGDGVETYEPRFTLHGFRYVKIEGFPDEPAPENLTGVALYSDTPLTGEFTCSDPLINQLQSNLQWSQKSNFVEIPTDCPQRERAGWTGDAQIFARTACFNMDVAAFFTRWLKDLAAEQRGNGMVTNLVPNSFRRSGGMMANLEGSAGWGDAAVIIPWTLYLCYGDERVLAAQYASMQGWVDYMAACAQETHWTTKLSPSFRRDPARQARAQYIWDTRYHWGEWLEPGGGTLQTALGVMHNMVLSRPDVATAYFAYSSGLLARIAALLGKPDDAARYGELHDKVKAAYIAEFVEADGVIRPDTQAAYVRSLAFDLIPAELRAAAARRLVVKIRQNGNHLGTGFLSTVFLCHVLSENGYLDVAYDLLNQKTCPSWLYPVTKGATTIWEMWDAVREDGSLSGSMNHYSYGAIGSWLYQVVAGIELDPAQPGYRHFYVQPQPGGGLTWARATYESIHGEIGAGWEHTPGGLRLEVTIPPNTRATVRLPGAGPAEKVTEYGMPLCEATGISDIRQQDGALVFEAGSGNYVFEYQTLTG